MSSTRRSLLAGFALPLAATACHPIIPVGLPRHAASEHPDAALLILGARVADASAHRYAAYGRLCEAEDRLVIPDQPEVLIATNFDVSDGFPHPRMHHDVRGRTWTAAQVEDIRAAAPRRAFFVSGGSRVCERTARRKAEILAAYDAYRSEIRAREDASGQTAAEADHTACGDRLKVIAAEILAAPAATAEGLAVKARAHVALYGAPTPARPDDVSSENLMRSILTDILAAAGGFV